MKQDLLRYRPTFARVYWIQVKCCIQSINEDSSHVSVEPQKVNRSLTADGNFSDDVTPWYRMISQTCLNVSSAEVSPASLPTNLWDFSEALFLAMTILTTIGKFNFVP